MGLELRQAGRFLQLLGVLVVRELGVGGGEVWIGKDSWVCQEASPATPPETLPLPHPHTWARMGGPRTRGQTEARERLRGGVGLGRREPRYFHLCAFPSERLP